MKKIIISAISLVSLGGIGGTLLAHQHHNTSGHHSEHHAGGTADSHDHHRDSSHDHASTDHGDAKQHQSHAAQTQVTLLSEAVVPPKTAVPLSLLVQDQQGQAIADFELFQEKLMHLIIVSEDLQTFQHLHPTYQGEGQFEITTQLPKSGNYTLFSDYKPKGLPEQVSAVSLKADGESGGAPEPDLRSSQMLGNTKVTLQASASTLKAGESVELNFILEDSETQTAATDLQPYLGSLGHLVIVKQSPSLSRSDYLHAHAIPTDQTGSVAFHTAFPEPGFYKAWGQFQRSDQLLTSSFWLKVEQ